MHQVLNIGSPIVVLMAGAMFLFMGYRLVKVVAVVNLAALGAVLGRDVALALEVQRPLWGVLIGAVVFGLIAIPLLRAAVVVAVGSMAGIVAKQAWVYLGGDAPLQWAALAGGFIVGALLGWIFFRFLMIVTSSIMGAVCIVYGAASLIAGRLISSEDLNEADAGYVLAGVVAFVVLMLLGIVVQYRGSKRLKAKRESEA